MVSASSIVPCGASKKLREAGAYSEGLMRSNSFASGLPSASVVCTATDTSVGPSGSLPPEPLRLKPMPVSSVSRGPVVKPCDTTAESPPEAKWLLLSVWPRFCTIA